jgi:non-heme chloroperoxidase
MMVGHKNAYDCIAAFSATDFTQDLKRFDKPTLVIHGDDDQVVPIDASARSVKRLLPNAQLIVYEGAPHGITDTHKERLNTDLLTSLDRNLKGRPRSKSLVLLALRGAREA